MSHVSRDTLPIVVIGAGPVGLAAAAHLVDRGLELLVLEVGGSAGASIQQWGHVRMFSPWRYLVDPVVRKILEGEGWTMPEDEALPTGAELVDGLLTPLSQTPALAPHIRYGHRVVSVSRLGMDKVRSGGRADAPFEVVCETDTGEHRFLGRAVIDASGTYVSPNPLGSGGLPAVGEHASRPHIDYGMPDVRDRDRARYAGKRVLVVGSGHSAFNVLLDLAWVKTEVPATKIVWAIRRHEIGQLFGGGASDALPARGSLGSRLRRLVDLGLIDLVTGFRATEVSTGAGGLSVRDRDTVVQGVDRVVVATGFRPELKMLRELRLALDPALESPVALAPLIDPNVHSCGTVYPHGFQELRHPERDFYVVGMKSYGRAPTFLLLTGYEQVRSVVAALAGDMSAARDVRLVLPETGVCSTDAGGSGCCGSSESESPGVGETVGAETVGAVPGGVAPVGAAAGGCGCG
jgi:hypothetical protein